MLSVNLLGRGGMMPLPGRYLTALYVRYDGTAILVDCGEGTQVAIREAGLGFRHIGIILFTHFHADHIAGLPGLLLTIGNSGRTEPVTIVGPKDIGTVVKCLCVVAPLPFQLQICELSQSGDIMVLGPMTIGAQFVEHAIPCYAYRFDVKRQGRFDPGRAREAGIPVKLWKRLQQGEPVEEDGRTYRPEEVLGPARRGLRLCYATDLRPAQAIPQFAQGADLFICEGIYGDPALLEKAKDHNHCHFREAADMAREAGAKELWLTHYSPSLSHPEEWLSQATDRFPATYLDRDRTELRFPEE